MCKINNSAIMNESAENSATTHTHNRWQQLNQYSVDTHSGD